MLQCCLIPGVTVAVTAQQIKGVPETVDSLNKSAFEKKRTNISEALVDLYKAQNLAIQLGYKKGEAISYMYEAGIYQQQGFLKRAIVDSYEALEIFRSIKDTFNIAKVNQQLAASLVSDKKYDSAIAVFNKSLQVYEKYNKNEDIINIKNNLGQIRLELYQMSAALRLFNEALELSRKIGYRYGEKKALHNLGLAEIQRSHIGKAEQYFKKSLAIDEAMNDKYGIALKKVSLIAIYLPQKRLAEAETLGLSAFSIAQSIDAFDLLDSIVSEMIELNKLSNNKEKVIQWQDSALEVLNKQRVKENEYASSFIDIIKSQHDSRMETENAIMRAERVSNEQFLIITVGTFILIILAVLVIMVFINFQKQKQFSRELRAKNVVIEAQVSELGTLNKEISQQNILLEADNKTKDKLLSIISHDLRNPLVNTKGILNLVNQGMVPEEQAKQLLIQLETQYMGTTSLLDNLLFWLKGQMSGKNLDKVQMPVFPIVKGLEDEHRMLLERKNISFFNQVDPSLTVLADKEMIRIVLRNLISNAIKFTPENGLIRVYASSDEQETRISIQDSGIGMSAETIQRISAKQYYTTAGTAMEKGSGFGLMLCSDLVNRHGGKLIIESEPRKGSVFTITLPA
ncbi:MAG: tetratricopeptide repeat-containing sensor histidine kinase [Sphingobacteriia bacterium]|nr:tetratricopeptide repeat-containing sensor histidine kinase [Sphingobacteriia bacterium]